MVAIKQEQSLASGPVVQWFDVLLRGVSAWVACTLPQHDVLHSDVQSSWKLT